MAIIKQVRGFDPQFGKNCFLVIVGDEVSIWFNTVLRGDVNFIKVGNRTNIQDGVVIHGSYKRSSTTIGNEVTIGHNAIVHGCTLEDRVLIGMGAIVMDQAYVQSGSIVAAGSVVLEGTKIPSGSVFAGTPAKKVKEVDDKLFQIFQRTAKNYIFYSSWYRDGTEP
ncbi:MAG: gamma carbonic anhydrase family protein [Bacteroidetes bacterium]|nr:gamma carbonic anhydrase family protein [Bacteroidota bacterium]